MHRLLIITCFYLLPLLAICQKQVGMEQYYYWQGKTMGIIVPKVYYQSPKNWYGELRYNYEDVQTVSMHLGKKMGFKKIPALEVTPVFGVVLGKLNGGSAGTVIEVNVDKFCFFSEPQYVCSFQQEADSYIYSWTEVSYEVFSFLYAGIALQQTKPYSLPNVFEPGLMAGISIKNFDIPIYFFSPASSNKNFVLGVNWRWEK